MLLHFRLSVCIVVAALLASTLAFSQEAPEGQTTGTAPGDDSSTSAAASARMPQPKPAELGLMAKPLQIKQWIKGTTVTLEEGQGKLVYVVEFWATWCPPCRASIPHLTELAKKYKNKGVVFAGISDEDADAVEPFVKKQGDSMDYHVAIDDLRKTNKDYMEPFRANGIPHAFIVDKQGRIIWSGHPMVGLEETLEKVVSGKFDLAAEKKSQAVIGLVDEYRTTVGSNASEAKGIGERVLTEAGSNWSTQNELAWYILTSPTLTDRDLDLALRLSKKGCETTSFKNGMMLDTYARALFETGKIKEAITREKAAIKLSTSERERDEMEAALKRYTIKP